MPMRSRGGHGADQEIDMKKIDFADDFAQILKNLGPPKTTKEAQKKAPLLSLIEDTKAWQKVPGNLARILDIKKRFEGLDPHDQASFSQLMRGDPVEGVKAYNLLDSVLLGSTVAADRKSWIKLATWAIKNIGCSPNRYNGDNVPVGCAGYTGQADMLKLFHKNGADLVLCLSEAHAGGNASLIGTTLLQRIAQRPEIFNRYDMDDTIDYLVVNTPLSLKPDARGFNALTDPLVISGIETIIQTACSRKEANDRATKARNSKGLPAPRPRQRP